MTTYIRVKQDQTTVYPYALWQLREDFPNTSFPQPYELAPLADFGVFPVTATAKPSSNRVTQVVEETTPVKIGNDWTQQWTVRSATPGEQAQAKAVLQQEIVDATQQRLDDFAKTRQYDGILSACTYSTSPTPKFQAEGQYCVAQRDATWAKLYEMLAEVEAGTRPIPQSFADVEPELPALVWPV